MERMSDEPDRTPVRPPMWIALGTILLLLALVAYFRETGDQTAGAGMKVAEVAGEPATYTGRTVTISGEVEDVLGPRAFVIGDDGPGGEEMLVVASAADVVPKQVPLSEVDDIRVAGEVRPFDSKLLDEAGLAPGDERVKELAGAPVLYALQIIVPPAEVEKHARANAD